VLVSIVAVVVVVAAGFAVVVEEVEVSTTDAVVVEAVGFVVVGFGLDFDLEVINAIRGSSERRSNDDVSYDDDDDDDDEVNGVRPWCAKLATQSLMTLVSTSLPISWKARINASRGSSVYQFVQAQCQSHLVAANTAFSVDAHTILVEAEIRQALGGRARQGQHTVVRPIE
jgi:hypothetical protein